MGDENHLAVIQLPELKWPTSFQLSCSRFRLLIAADIGDISIETLSEFALAALNRGMVYFCAWGDDCEKFHDIVDELVVRDSFSERKFVGPTASDTIMTTWHADESLEEALDFFTRSAIPTQGFADDCCFRLVICVGNPVWAANGPGNNEQVFAQTADNPELLCRAI